MPFLQLRRLLLVTIATCGALGACDGEGEPVDTLVPALTTSTNALDFGATYVGTNKTLSVTLTSTGTAPLMIASISVDNDGSVQAYTLLSGDPRRLAPQTSLDIEIFYAPSSDQPHTGTLRVAHDATASAITEIALRGQGRLPPDCDDGNPCTDNVFDFESENCLVVQLNTACDDDNACTANDRCVQGECRGEIISCVDDDNGCTVGSCDSEHGCLLTPEDSLCDDQNPCTVDRCDAESGCSNTALPDYTLCGPYTQCGGTPVCLASDCLELPVEDGTPCDDDNVCTIDDGCQEGACTGTRIEREPELVAEVFLLAHGDGDGIEDVRNPNLALGADTYLFPANHLQLVNFVPGANGWERTEVIATYPEFSDAEEFVHVVGPNLAFVLLDYDVIALVDFTFPQSPQILDAFPVQYDDDEVAVFGPRILVCANSEDGEEDGFVLLSASVETGIQEFTSADGSRLGACGSELTAVNENTAVVIDQSDESIIFFRINGAAFTYERLGAIPFSTGSFSDWGGIALSTDTFYVLREGDNSTPNPEGGKFWELLTGEIPSLPWAPGEEPALLTRTFLADFYDLRPYVADSEGLVVEDDHHLFRLTPDDSLEPLVLLPAEVSDTNAMSPTLVSYETAASRWVLGRIVDGEFRVSETEAMGPLSQLTRSGDDLWGFNSSSFFRISLDGAIDGSVPPLIKGLSQPPFFDSIGTNYPGGQFWAASVSEVSGAQPALPSLIRNIETNGTVTTASFPSIDIHTFFDLAPGALVRASRLEGEGCLALIYANVFPPASAPEHHFGLMQLCGPAPGSPISRLQLEEAQVPSVALSTLLFTISLQLSDDSRWARLQIDDYLLALVDFQNPSQPIARLTELFSADTTGRLLDSEVDDGYLISLLGGLSNPAIPGDFPDRLQVRRLDTLDALPYSVDLSLGDPSDDELDGWRTSEPRILAIQSPRAFISQSHFIDGALRYAVEVYNLHDGFEPPTLDARVIVHDEPVDAEVVEDKLFVLTRDGLSTISPPCGPSDE